MKSPYRFVRAPSTRFAKTIALDSAQAICSPNAGRPGSWYGAHVHVARQPIDDVGVHQLAGVRGRGPVEVHELRMQQVERRDVQGRGDRDAPAAVHEPSGEVQSGAPVVQAAVDVRGRRRRVSARRVHRPRPSRRRCASRARRLAARSAVERGAVLGGSQLALAPAHLRDARSCHGAGGRCPGAIDAGRVDGRLKAVMLNCTLKYAPEVSNTEALMLKVNEWWDTMDVETEIVRVVDYDVRFGVSSDEGDGDEWPPILEKIKAADIIVIGTPIWFGVRGHRSPSW